MIAGSVLLYIFIVVFILLGALSVFCYCYGDNSTKYSGHLLNNEGSSTKEAEAPRKYKRQCSCTASFKGLCEDCKAPEFVNDGPLGEMPDFSNYGGNLGFDGVGIGPQAKEDPNNRGFMGKSLNPWSGPKPGTIKQDHYV